MKNNAITFHDQLAANWEGKYAQKSFSRREQVLDECLNQVILEGQCWLDAGCGTGRLARVLALRGAAVTGLDGSAEMVRVARDEAARIVSSYTPTFEVVETLDRLSLDGESFDGVLCNSVIEYLDRPTDALDQMVAALRPAGLLLVSVPNRRSLFRRSLMLVYSVMKRLRGRGWPPYLEFSMNEYTREEFAQLLERLGLRVERVIYFGGPLPTWLQRLAWVGPLCMFVTRKSIATRKP